MDRFTQRNANGIAYTLVPLNKSQLEIGTCYTGKIAERIAAYEDTGMTPEDIMRLDATARCAANISTRLSEKLVKQEERTHKARRQRDALRAENDAYKADIEAGRLQRLPNFPQNMDDLLEPLKVQSALNSEVMKLNFRKEHRPKDVSILDYTIIAALNKVLMGETARAALWKRRVPARSRSACEIEPSGTLRTESGVNM